jgi:hypothetical protein
MSATYGLVYDRSYVAIRDTPFWNYKFGQSPLQTPAAGIIPAGSQLCLQRPPSPLDILQSAYQEDRGRIIIQPLDFEPA